MNQYDAGHRAESPAQAGSFRCPAFQRTRASEEGVERHWRAAS